MDASQRKVRENIPQIVRGGGGNRSGRSMPVRHGFAQLLYMELIRSKKRGL
jgi:hypothetical protein